MNGEEKSFLFFFGVTFLRQLAGLYCNDGPYPLYMSLAYTLALESESYRLSFVRTYVVYVLIRLHQRLMDDVLRDGRLRSLPHYSPLSICDSSLLVCMHTRRDWASVPFSLLSPPPRELDRPAEHGKNASNRENCDCVNVGIKKASSLSHFVFMQRKNEEILARKFLDGWSQIPLFIPEEETFLRLLLFHPSEEQKT